MDIPNEKRENREVRLKENDALKKDQPADEQSAEEHAERMKLDEADQLTAIVVNALEEKKAINVDVMKVTAKTTLADIFVVATGTSSTHIKTLADYVEEKLKEVHDLRPNHTEGLESRNWVLLDYGDIVVHLMLEEDRQFYNLESLWRVDTHR